VIAQGTTSTAYLYGYLPAVPGGGYRWLFQQGASLGEIPTNDGLACVFVSVPTARYDAELRRDPAAAFMGLLRAIDPGLVDRGRALRREDLHMFRGRKGFIRQAHGPGWALVGDAGFFRDPLTAHGITDALRDAEGLASAVTAGTVRALEEYAAERDALALPLMRVTDEIASYDWSFDELRDRHRRFSALMKQEVALISSRGRAPDRSAAA
jgi:2-polyprenyl-6-methoxyphenol hydroxylase-like FAD-dependent oxidoreductase